MDFSKYNKGLRFYVTLFDLNPDIFNTDNFIDIVVLEKENGIGILYKSYYDQFIKQEITNNKYYFNNDYVNYKDKEYYAYKIKANNKESTVIFDDIYRYNSLFLDNHFYIKMCIIWRKYLDNSFYEIV